MESYYARKGHYKNSKVSRIVIVKKVGRDLKSKALPKPDKMWKLLEEMDSAKKCKINKGDMDRNFG